MQIHQPSLSPPAGLLESLATWPCKYSDPQFLYHCIWTDLDTCVGVFGDGSNASYEWFIWRGRLDVVSEKGYGSPAPALRDALIEAL